ncbi:MAG: ABC transporter ATP-binding protein [Anaerolineae bacterium]|nr:ABC transporter ATP-binding protein [Anaerolineae bacterium]
MDQREFANRRIQHMEMCDITKQFPGVLANNQVCIDVRAGEVLALLGENGAGKSTLMKILYGLYRPDAGEIRINDQTVPLHSPNDAIAQGIGMVHQHFMLVPTLTVVENIVLGLPSSKGIFLDLDVAAKRITELSQKYGLQVDPWAYVWQLSVGEQQRVEILKVLYRGADLLILDEPTAVLTPQEVDELIPTLEEMTRMGHSIIFITHKLREVMAISNKVTVLRNGQVIDTLATADTNQEALARMMVGRELLKEYDKAQVTLGETVLEVKSLCAKDDKGLPALKKVTFEVRAGEILGVAGVSGNGQRELADVIAGLQQATSGQVIIAGKDVTNKLPAYVIDAGMGYIPEDRLHTGTIPSFSISENVILKDNARPPIARGPFLDFEEIARYSKRLVQEFAVKTPTLETQVGNLSGGNIQKLILAREISREPAFLLAAQPTRGLDVGAMEYVHQRLLEQRAAGKGILLVSEELDEIFKLADRIAVIYEGQIMDILSIDQADREHLGLLMAGVTQAAD